jgi:hypothetical protein
MKMGGLLFGGHMAGKKDWEQFLEKKKTGHSKALANGSPMLCMHIQLGISHLTVRSGNLILLNMASMFGKKVLTS